MRRLLLSASLALALAPLPALAQGGAAPAATASSGDTFNLSSVDALLAQGDADAASGNLAGAIASYDKARNAARSLLSFYRDLGGSFRGLDARIPRAMDAKGRESIEKLAKANLRLAAAYRRQSQSEVAVPLLVEVVKLMTPTSADGRKAYQQLLEIGFVSIPYNAPASGN
mgnify:CR=1 FL=1